MNSNVGQGMSGVNASPSLCVGQLWSAKALMLTLQIGEKTLAQWEQAGLQQLKPGTKGAFYLSDDVIQVMRLPADKIPKYSPKRDRQKKKES